MPDNACAMPVIPSLDNPASFITASTMGLANWYCNAEFISCSGNVAPEPVPLPSEEVVDVLPPLPGMPLTWKMRIDSIFSIGRAACSRMWGNCCSSSVHNPRYLVTTPNRGNVARTRKCNRPGRADRAHHEVAEVRRG